MASETEFSAMFERMVQIDDRYPRFFPLILALAEVADEEGTTAREQVERRIVMISSDWLVREFLDGVIPFKPVNSPASKTSVESMPRVVIDEDKEKGGGSCAICLEEWSEGDVAAEMPYKHEFHSKCVEEWLGIQSTCPLCRYEMPVEEGEERKKVGVWIGFSVNGGERRGEEEEGR